MKRQIIKKIITIGILSVSLFVIVPISESGEWKQDNTGWWYSEGNSWTNGWQIIGCKWYFFDKNGYMKTGWIQDNNKWYYLYDSGEMAKNTTIKGYELGSDGAWIQNEEKSESNSNVMIKNNNISDSNNSTSKNIEQAVSNAIKSQGEQYLKGEAATEGHEILEIEEKDNVVKAYTISSFGYFSFEKSYIMILYKIETAQGDYNWFDTEIVGNSSLADTPNNLLINLTTTYVENSQLISYV